MQSQTFIVNFFSYPYTVFAGIKIKRKKKVNENNRNDRKRKEKINK